MRMLLGLDYELFFGRRAGSPERCLLEPTEALIGLGRRLGLRFCLFVDVGYLVALRRESQRYPSLRRVFDAIANQLALAVDLGHDVQLHVHPHWEDSHFDGDEWVIDTRRYRLHDFSTADVEAIVRTYKVTLTDVCQRDVFAFRAGGWCLQPFAGIGAALRSNGLWLDSTVFPGGYNPTPTHGFDFRTAPQLDSWRFDSDPLTPVADGFFFELPISSISTGPAMYWSMALARLFRHGGERWKRFGDGDPIDHASTYYFSRLLGATIGPASVDGVKAAQLCKHFRARQGSREFFNVMGHPKSLTRFSLEKLSKLMESCKVDWATFQDFASCAPPVQQGCARAS